MVTVLFACPQCHIHCIYGITCNDETYALATDIPIRVRCWCCGAESFVVRSSARRARLQAGTSDGLFGYCLRIAAQCRRRAVATRDRHLQKLLLRIELHWLQLAEQSDGALQANIVPARHRGLGASPSPAEAVCSSDFLKR